MEGAELWDVASGKNTAKFKPDPADSVGTKNPNDMVWSVAFSPDGKTLVTGLDVGTYFWDVSRLRP